ncbi:MAG: ABC transporter permease [Actinobacteria bacterium RBG_16_68_21]|nr:MAG: ABC transporter permease [Actinobacteria bacterium RBG_16_68_21]
MTAPATVVRSPAEIRRARRLGITYIVLAAFVLWVFGMGSLGEGSATFKLVRPTDRFKDFPDLVLPAAGIAFVIAAALAAFGGIQLTRGFKKLSNVVLAVGFILFIFAFLAWAAAGSSFSLVGMLDESVKRSVPIAMGALAGVMCERVAVINIAIEGMLLGGAFVAAIVGSQFGSFWALVGATMVGVVLAWVLAVLAVRYRVDQIIVGVVINVFVLGLTSFISQRILNQNPHLNNATLLRPIKIPLLGDIPFFGQILFQQNIFVFAMFILVAVMTYSLFHTKWGLRSRAVGEHPKAADTLGVNVYRYRYLNVMMGGAIAGFGGAFYIQGSVGRFDENMTAGKGFVGLAAMIFGRWHPVGAMAAALVFGFADSIQGKLAILKVPIPSEFLLMAPYLATIIVVAGVVGRARPPAADGQPYVKE